MSTEETMTIVTALIRPHMEGRVVHAHHTPSDLRGQGRERGAGDTYETGGFGLTYQRPLQLQLICPAGAAEEICRMVGKAAWIGRKGDDVVFTSHAGSFWRIREARQRGQTR